MNTNVATLNREPGEIRQYDAGTTHTANMLMNPQIMENLHNFAQVMAKGAVTVPQHLRGNVGDCMAIAMQAAQWGMNPFAVAQKTHLVSGTLGYEAQLVSAVINALAPTKDRIHYEWFGDWTKVIGKFVERTSQKGNKYIAPDWSLKDEQGLGVKAWATLKGETEPRVIELLLSQAQVRNSTLWASDPKQQLAYLAIKRWSRLYCPEVILGVYTLDELEQQSPVEREINPRQSAAASSSLSAKIQPTEPVADPSQQPDQSDHMPDFGAERDPQRSPVSELLQHLPACKTKQDLDEWKTAAMAWPETSPEHAELVGAFNTHIANLKHAAAHQEG